MQTIMETVPVALFVFAGMFILTCLSGTRR
jgi:hypothetical protein